MINFKTNPILADALPAMSQKDLQVYSTYDLSVFKTLEGNRNINILHVERLVKSIQENGFLKMPIIVNKNYEVIDGQHRLEAAKKIKSMIFYIIEKTYDLNTAIILNANASNWSLIDYVKSYCDLGVKDYLLLYNLYKQNKDFSLNICAELTTIPNNGQMYLRKSDIINSDFIRKGLFKFNINNNAEYIFEALRKINGVIPESKGMAFCRSIKTCMKNSEFDLNTFVKKALNYPSEYRKNSHLSVIIANIEHIYNFRNQGHTRIILQSK
jgi:hypothetical protein